MKIIINNLISNAIKYADCSKQEMFITIKTYFSDGVNKIEVADNGIGIHDDHKENIFEIFFLSCLKLNPQELVVTTIIN